MKIAKRRSSTCVREANQCRSKKTSKSDKIKEVGTKQTFMEVKY